MTYSRCRPFATLIPGPVPRVSIHARELDTPGLVVAAATNIERVSPRLLISNIDTSLSGAGRKMIYTLDIVIDGVLPELRQVVQVVAKNGLLTVHDERLRRAIAAAGPTLSIPAVKRHQLQIMLESTDEPGIVARVANAALDYGASFSRFHGEVLPSGRFPGTPDYVIDSIAGFSSEQAAEAARVAILRLPYDSVRVRRLYDVTDRPETGIAIAA